MQHNERNWREIWAKTANEAGIIGPSFFLLVGNVFRGTCLIIQSLCSKKFGKFGISRLFAIG